VTGIRAKVRPAAAKTGNQLHTWKKKEMRRCDS
jgi:hypothetical protein